ncbi:hypothetical protein BRADI_1g44276v3 [Brachypodium distachyon]|uniref:Uncharacterized protein n=1 Tax=Brachypodium distachyon TaxID=15368 RepID=A0A2K2DPB1_BRADI|nr:hypothetical protein BRADI_1g44276v3 [Brachypodium distachyon]
MLLLGALLREPVSDLCRLLLLREAARTGILVAALLSAMHVQLHKVTDFRQKRTVGCRAMGHELKSYKEMANLAFWNSPRISSSGGN